MRALTFLSVAGVVGLALISTQATAATRFGARLTAQTQPSNAESGRFCPVTNQRPDCTWLMTEALGRPGSGHLAPKTGTIAKVRIIACRPGSFALQIARQRPGTDQARVIRTGPQITYAGDSRRCRGLRFEIEEFPVNVPVRQGDSLAVVTQKLGFAQCAGNGGILLFHLPLPDGGPLRPANDNESCLMLLEAEYND